MDMYVFHYPSLCCMIIAQDEDAGRTEGEGLNDFPEMKLMLRPGGCAFYTFPVSEDQVDDQVDDNKSLLKCAFQFLLLPPSKDICCLGPAANLFQKYILK